MPAKLFRYCQRNKTPLLLLGCVILLASFLRLLFLDRIPNVVTLDELTYFLNTKAIVLTGHDMAGNWNPWSIFFFNYPPGQVQAELPYFLFIPAVGFNAYSLLTAHITNALLSILTVIVMFLVARRLFDSQTALIAGFLAAINPWFIVIGRTGYEVVSATLLFLLILYLLLICKRWKILLVLPVLLLAFYSYIGTKTVLFAFLLVGVVYVYFAVRNKKDGVFYLVLLVTALSISVCYLLLITLHPSSSRLGEILTPFSNIVAQQVDAVRKTSIQTALTPIFINKFSVYTSLILAKLLSTLSPSYLFLTGDSFFSFWNHGVFYVLDIVFLFAGVLQLFRTQGKTLVFLLVMVGIGLTPQLLHGISADNFTPHIALIFPFFLFFIACGIMAVVRWLALYRLEVAGLGIVIMLYLVSLLGFMNNYFYQNSLQKQSVFTSRILSRYLSLANREGLQVNVYSPHLVDAFTAYLFYANAYNRQTVSQVRDIFSTRNYVLGNIHFLSCDKNFTPSSSKISLYDTECGNPQTTSTAHAIKQLSDGGAAYLIYNDRVCSTRLLKNYPYGLKLSDFQVESLSPSVFCSTYIFQ